MITAAPIRTVGLALVAALALCSPGGAQIAPPSPPAPQLAPAPASLPAPAIASPSVPQPPRAPSSNEKSSVRSGVLSTHSGLRLRLSTDLGNVTVHTGAADHVNYTVRIETDSSGPEADRWIRRFDVSASSSVDGVTIVASSPRDNFDGHLSVNFDVTVPSAYNLDISTRGGNIEVEDITGRVALVTAGGNITSGQIFGSARLDTRGGHIYCRSVSGDLTATTAGGHIRVFGPIGGNASLKTGGGHITVSTVGGAATLETGGGNISVERAGAGLTAETGGGQIDAGDVAGIFRARTGGGGIKVANVTGLAEVNSGAGSIYLTQVGGAVRASTGAGGITAWFGPDARFSASSLDSGQGDIVVYLPKLLSVTVDATIEAGDEHHFVVDPALPLAVNFTGTGGSFGTVHARGTLNGGGILLRLRTVAGNIQVKLLDAALQLQQQMKMDQIRILKDRIQVQPKTPKQKK